MYHRLVAGRIRRIFHALGHGDYEPMLASLAPKFTYRFEGDTSIGGERRTQPSMRAWWDRMYRLFPGLRFEIRDVLVAGPPWRTRVATYLKFVVPQSDGSYYENEVVQIIRLRWGRVTFVHTIEDSLRCARRLEELARGGLREAVAPAISD